MLSAASHLENFPLIHYKTTKKLLFRNTLRRCSCLAHRKLFFNPGFVLQQCAYINNSLHFSKIIENPNVTEEDVGYTDDDSGGDNPIMIAARYRQVAG